VQASVNAGPIRIREHQDATTASSGLAALLSSWALVGFEVRFGRWVGFIAAGSDLTILPIRANGGTFSSQLVDMFKLDGGVKVTAELAIGMTF